MTSFSKEGTERNFAQYSQVDFDVPSPSFEQVPQLIDFDHIDYVSPYYFLNRNLQINSQSFNDIGVVFFNNFDSLNNTMYNENRIISNYPAEVENPILIDYRFSKYAGIKLGDYIHITFGDTFIPFQVKTIYQDNIYYQNPILVGQWNGLHKSLIETQIGKALKYSGAYITSNNPSLTKAYLSTSYKPFGRLRDASEFTSQNAYQIHYDAFFSSTYSNEITDFELLRATSFENANDFKLEGNSLFITASILMFIINLVINFSLTLRKTELRYFKHKSLSGSSYSSYYLYDLVYQFLLNILVLFTFLLFISASSFTFISSSIYNLIIITFICVNLVSISTSYIISYKLIS